MELGLAQPRTEYQLGCFAAGLAFARAEGILPAPAIPFLPCSTPAVVMPELPSQWQTPSPSPLPAEFVRAVQEYALNDTWQYLAQLLWQRGIRQPELLAGFLDPACYQPTSPFAFGAEMEWAVERIQQARQTGEVVAIWGDFDADGVTATAVLWDGLGQFFQPHRTLVYYIPNRLTESHGLSQSGIDQLQQQNCRLIITCDTGSTNQAEIDYARSLGLDVIITDHHTLPAERPPVTAIINPRYLSADHPLATLSGVAVAYKLVEALYERLPAVPQQPLEHLLDLVAIGLIADLVELKGDCRYLAQRGIEQLQRQANPATATRPGLTKLLELCKRTGDRPTDISFGLGPRINAVSRIQGDAHFCVELLTSQDSHLCSHLAEATELANARRKALQKDLTKQVRDRLAHLDLSTTGVIVLADEQWHPGVLGLVAGQIAQEYGRPTILLSIESEADWPSSPLQGQSLSSPFPAAPSPYSPLPLARGSARSAHNLDLYQLVQDQQHLLHRFGGHPLAAGLSLPVENLSLFTEAINQRSLQQLDLSSPVVLDIDLEVTVAELGKDLFQTLKLLEPCGMGNPAPRLLIRNGWFTEVKQQKIRDRKGQVVQYIKTDFALWDATVRTGFPGIWWGHYPSELPPQPCDVVVELDWNAYRRRYEVRLIAVRSAANQSVPAPEPSLPELLDWRGQFPTDSPSPSAEPLVLRQCPSSWAEFRLWWQRAQQQARPLAIAYSRPEQPPPQTLWSQLVGIAKYLSRTGQIATRQQLRAKLEVGDRCLQLGFRALQGLGFTLTSRDAGFQIEPGQPLSHPDTPTLEAIQQFLAAVQEEQFQRAYFYQLPLDKLRLLLNQVGAEAAATKPE